MNLNYKKIGNGPPILILHGLFGMLDNWVSFGRELGKRYTVYLIDLRNHGKSPHDKGMSYDLMASDVHDFVVEHDLDRVHVLGHSMGGKVAMVLALNYEEIVNSIIIIDIAPKAYPSVHREILDAMLNIDLKVMNSRDEIYDYLFHQIKERSIVQFLMKNISRSKAGLYDWKMNLSVINEHYKHIIDMVGAPWTFDGATLFINGEMSNYIQEEDTHLIAQLFPNNSIQTIEGAGHWVHADKPTELLSEVVKFLNNE